MQAILIFLVALCSAIIGYPQTRQTELDSLLKIVERHSGDSLEINALNNLGRLYHSKGQYDSSLFFHRSALSIAASNGHSSYLSECYQGISASLLWQLKYDSAKLYLSKAETLAKKNEDYSDLAGIYNSVGNIFLQEGNNAEALRHYILTAKIQDSALHDPLGQSRALANIGNIQYHMGNFDKALDYAKQAQDVSLKNNLKRNLAYTFQLMGRIFRKQKKLDQALTVYEKSLTQYLEMGLKREVCETYISIGNIYLDKSSFYEAQEKYKLAISISKNISNEPLLGMAYSVIGITYQKLKNYPVAILFTDSAYRIGTKINDQYTVLDSYEVFSQIYASQNKYEKSLDFFHKFIDLRDSLNESANKAEMDELEMKYQNEKKTREIELLKSDQALRETDLARQRAMQIGTGIALLSVIIISVLLVNRFRIMNRAKRDLEIEKVRNNIARDLHDDIGSTLSSINILSKVALTEQNGDTRNYLQRIGDQSTRMMEDMSDMVWSINPRNDSMEKVITHMREFATEIFESAGIEYHFSENIKDGLTLDSDKRKNLFLIYKEAVNNAAKYSKANQVEIDLYQQDHSLILKVKDNGQGFDKQKITTGNGLRNQRDRAKEVNGNIIINSQLGQGTELELQLPIA